MSTWIKIDKLSGGGGFSVDPNATPAFPTLEANHQTTIDVSEYTEPVEVLPSDNKDGMQRNTITLVGLVPSDMAMVLIDAYTDCTIILSVKNTPKMLDVEDSPTTAEPVWKNIDTYIGERNLLAFVKSDLSPIAENYPDLDGFLMKIGNELFLYNRPIAYDVLYSLSPLREDDSLLILEFSNWEEINPYLYPQETNPSENDWYEYDYDSDEYVHTTDTTIDFNDKSYYLKEIPKNKVTYIRGSSVDIVAYCVINMYYKWSSDSFSGLFTTWDRTTISKSGISGSEKFVAFATDGEDVAVASFIIANSN